MFGVLHAVLLRPLPIRDQTHAVVLWSEAKNQPGAHVPLRNGFLWEVSRHSRAFSGVGSVALGGATAFMARDQDRTFPVAVSFVDGGFFSVLGTVPRYGRMLAPNDDEAGAPRVVVISDRLWRQQFGGDPKVIGRSIDLQGATQLIVGITPPGFAYPADADAWSSYPQMERRFSSAPTRTVAGSTWSHDSSPVSLSSRRARRFKRCSVSFHRRHCRSPRIALLSSGR